MPTPIYELRPSNEHLDITFVDWAFDDRVRKVCNRDSLASGWAIPEAHFPEREHDPETRRQPPRLSFGYSMLAMPRDLVDVLLPAAASQVRVELLDFRLLGEPWVIVNLFRCRTDLIESKSVFDPFRGRAPGLKYDRTKFIAVAYGPDLDDAPFLIEGIHPARTFCGPAFKARVDAAGLRSVPFTEVGLFERDGDPALPDRRAEQRAYVEHWDRALALAGPGMHRLGTHLVGESAMPAELQSAVEGLLRRRPDLAEPAADRDARLRALCAVIEALGSNVDTLQEQPGSRPVADGIDPVTDLPGLVGLYGREITARTIWRWEVARRPRLGTAYRLVSPHERCVLDVGAYLTRLLRERRGGALLDMVTRIVDGHLPETRPGDRIDIGSL